jgi:hypothetical protein
MKNSEACLIEAQRGEIKVVRMTMKSSREGEWIRSGSSGKKSIKFEHIMTNERERES